MANRPGGETPPSPTRNRCRCGHLPVHHMMVVSLGKSDSFRLDPSGPCAICGEGACRRFSPGGI